MSLVQRLLDRGLLDRVGGPAALTDLYTYAPSPGHFRHHLQHVKDKFVLRSIIQNSNEAIAQAYDAPDEVAALLDTVEARILAIREGSETTKAPTIKQSVEEVIEQFQALLAGEKGAQGIVHRIRGTRPDEQRSQARGNVRHRGASVDGQDLADDEHRRARLPRARQGRAWCSPAK